MRFPLFGLLLLSPLATAQLENARVGFIDFYALNGLDPNQLRAALTVHPGDRLLWPATPEKIREELTKVAGRPYTHFSPVCCDKESRWMLYIGFGGPSAPPALRPKPSADLALAPELTALYDEFMATLPEALKFAAGTPEDYSKGYSLSSHPPMRAIQMRMREAALANEEPLLRVLLEAANDKQRIAASQLTGYTRQSPRQIEVLIEASRDPNDTVRNNATRALGVLAATPEFARQIPAAPFIDKLNSPVWSDRNKGLMLLTLLTRARDPQVLAAIRTKALPALIEMAQWQFAGHAAGPIRLLGRIAGMDESELDRLADKGDAGPVLVAIGKLQ
jgi:hypothetical protein